MNPKGIGLKYSLARSIDSKNHSKYKVMYRVCWAAHQNHAPKSYHFFSVSYRNGIPLTLDMVICPKCGRDSKPAPKWVRAKVQEGILLGKKLLAENSFLRQWTKSRTMSRTIRSQ